MCDEIGVSSTRHTQALKGFLVKKTPKSQLARLSTSGNDETSFFFLLLFFTGKGGDPIFLAILPWKMAPSRSKCYEKKEFTKVIDVSEIPRVKSSTHETFHSETRREACPCTRVTRVSFTPTSERDVCTSDSRKSWRKDKVAREEGTMKSIRVNLYLYPYILLFFFCASLLLDEFTRYISVEPIVRRILSKSSPSVSISYVLVARCQSIV